MIASLRVYLNRRSVREVLFFWFLLFLAVGLFIADRRCGECADMTEAQSRSVFIDGAVFASLSCLPVYLLYRTARFLFVNRFPRVASKLNIPLRKI